MGLKSLVIGAKIDKTINAHNCQANAKHRLQRGDRRLKVRNGRSWDHYCSSYAAAILSRDIEKLTALQREFPAAID
jgi:hypothetical protein